MASLETQRSYACRRYQEHENGKSIAHRLGLWPFGLRGRAATAQLELRNLLKEQKAGAKDWSLAFAHNIIRSIILPPVQLIRHST